MALETPYKDLNGLTPYRASLHNHTFKSGIPRAAPSVAVGIFRLCGINIVALTDHDRRIRPSRDITKGYVPWRPEDYYHEYDDCLLIRGYEASYPKNHVNVLGVPYLEVDESEGDAKEPGYTARLRQQQPGVFMVLNHPASHNDDPGHVLKDEDLRALDGIEVFNGNQSKNGRRSIATPLWDAWLGSGHAVWALANSDCHRYDFTEPSRPNNGWNVVWLEELSEEAFMEALRSGRFYASSGLEVDVLDVGVDTITVAAKGAAAIRFIGQGGQVLQEISGPEAAYTVQGHEGYVRVELDGAEKVYPDDPDNDLPRQAWLQPIFVS